MTLIQRLLTKTTILLIGALLFFRWSTDYHGPLDYVYLVSTTILPLVAYLVAFAPFSLASLTEAGAAETIPMLISLVLSAKRANVAGERDVNSAST